MSIFSPKRTNPEAARLADVDSRFAAVMRSQAVIEFNLDGTIIFANDNFLSCLGYRLEEIVGKHHSMFVDPAESSTQAYRDFWRQLNAGDFVAAKFRRIAKGGREVWIQASYNPVLDVHGRPFKVMKLATDITASEQEAIRNESARKRGEEDQARAVTALGDALRTLSQGDLTARIEGAFEGGYAAMRDDFNAAVESLRHAMEVIAGVAHPMQQASQEISDAAQDLSKRTEQQAASLEQTAAALDQITATVKSSATSVREASSVAEGAMDAARSSGEVVGEAVAAMSEIEQSSRKITEIIAVIDEIAFQTNLLALNAGVEAARAGDAGRGFAVVAQEVRALAQRSAEAAKEIKTLISSSRVQVEKGVALVGQTGESLSGLMDRASQIAKLIADIARSSQEQSGGLGEVNTAVNGMDKVTQQNAAMVEETSAAAAQLGLRSTELATAVTRFHLGESVQRRPAPRSAEPRRPSPNPTSSPAREMQGRLKAAVGGADSWEEF